MALQVDLFPELAPPPKARAVALWTAVRDRAEPAKVRRRKALAELRDEIEDLLADLRVDVEGLPDPESADEAVRFVEFVEDGLEKVFERLCSRLTS